MASHSIDAETLSVFIEDAYDVLGQWERFCFDLKPTATSDSFVVLMRCAHNLKGSAGLAGFENLHNRLHLIEDYLVRIRDNYGKTTIPFEETVATLLEVEQEIRRWIERLKVDPETEKEISSESIETGLKVLVGDLPSDLLTATSQTTANYDTTSAANQQTDEAASSGKENAGQRKESVKVDETLRVSALKLDRLIQLVGEISLNQSILARSAVESTLDSKATRTIIDLNSKLVQDLQDAALAIRMIPVEGLFQKIERMVRDTASKLNKQVHVERYGEDVTLDKLIVESMVEPLVHIARNAIDHGIETMDVRKQKGKAPSGKVKLTAENTSTGVSLIFEDDGKGIDGEIVFKKAVQRGLVDQGQELTPGAKLQLIFMPGLSTAEAVTELSGRGVGMDVVAAEVQRMAGQVEVQSEVGKGTRIHISLPTNLSIVDAIVIRSVGGLYAIPNRDIAEVIDLRDFPPSSVDGDHEQVFDLRNRIIPLADIETFLTSALVPKSTREIAVSQSAIARPRPAMIVRHHEDQLGISVDSVIGQQQVFVRPLLGHLRPVPYFSGTTILSDGEPCIILNLSEMARRYFTSQ
ncbi:MAG: chemotaxis protein CheW [Deltaproteobacteria bacterium]|nr:chemotaxis protein CheW [Deltaproteobacteria bacterium]